MTAINLGWRDVLVKQGWRIIKTAQHGPAGVTLTVLAPDGRAGSIIISQSDMPEDVGGTEWIHASVAFRDEDPTYRDLADLHRAVFGRKRWSYQVFAPPSSHVNIHAHALHLWGRADGKPMMPDFGGQLGGTI